MWERRENEKRNKKGERNEEQKMRAEKEANGLGVKTGREGSSGDATRPEVTCLWQALQWLEEG